MKVSGPIRRTERKTSRSVAEWHASPLFASPQGTARQGPDAQPNRTRFFFPQWPVKRVLYGSPVCSVPACVYIPLHFLETEATLVSHEEQFR